VYTAVKKRSVRTNSSETIERDVSGLPRLVLHKKARLID
jgi:hypothetical protein